jgi:hypothetical protein
LVTQDSDEKDRVVELNATHIEGVTGTCFRRDLGVAKALGEYPGHTLQGFQANISKLTAQFLATGIHDPKDST